MRSASEGTPRSDAGTADDAETGGALKERIPPASEVLYEDPVAPQPLGKNGAILPLQGGTSHDPKPEGSATGDTSLTLSAIPNSQSAVLAGEKPSAGSDTLLAETAATIEQEKAAKAVEFDSKVRSGLEEIEPPVEGVDVQVADPPTPKAAKVAPVSSLYRGPPAQLVFVACFTACRASHVLSHGVRAADLWGAGCKRC